jgi:signal-transduction protein with cAMP-binding, CBS, and nucleotidyltransferase domain
VTESFQECGYLAGDEQPFEPSFYVADVGEWTERFRDWITDPILKKFYQARPLFDLRPFAGDESLFHAIQASAGSSVKSGIPSCHRQRLSIHNSTPDVLQERRRR